MPVYEIKCRECKTIEQIAMTYEEREEELKKPCPKCGKKDVRFNKIGGTTFTLTRQFRNGMG